LEHNITSVHAQQSPQEKDEASALFSAHDQAAVHSARGVLMSVRERDWFPGYGCVLLRSEGIGLIKMSLMGLDGWQFASHV
jgi:hypothetical protein